MEKDQIPINFVEHLQLSHFGVQSGSISFLTATLESDHFVCVLDRLGKQVVVIDLADANNVMRLPVAWDIDSAIMHPSEKIIALKSPQELQVLNAKTHTRIKTHQLTEPVIFWKWISDEALGLVTRTSVYRWSTTNATSSPEKVFDQHSSLAGAQMINYRVTPDGKWHVLIGLASDNRPGSFKVKGAMQLYNKERGVSQPVEGHAAAFAELRLDGAPYPSKLFVFAVRTATGAKLHIVEIDHQHPNPIFPKRAVDIFFPKEAINDFPVAMQVSKRHGIIYLITKFGFIHLNDLESGTNIYMNRISGENVFVTSKHKATDGIIGVNKLGQVLSVNADVESIVSYILNTSKNPGLASKMERRLKSYDPHLQSLQPSGQLIDTSETATSSSQDTFYAPQSSEQPDDITMTSPSVPLTNDISDAVSLTSTYRVGSGGFGDLFMGHHKDRGKVALKRPHALPDGPAVRRFLREVDLWCSISNRYVLPCLGMCRIGPDVYVVSPFIQNGDLLSCMNRGITLNRNKLLYEVAEALTHLHYRGIVHGDLKAQNILLADDGSALLCDFGLAKAFDSMVTSTEAKGFGSIRWMAPELLMGEGRSMASDVYSFGLTISEVLSGRVPFHDLKDNVAVMVHLLNFDRRPPKEPMTSPNGSSYAILWETAEKCWVKDAKARPLMAQVLAMLFPLARSTA